MQQTAIHASQEVSFHVRTLASLDGQLLTFKEAMGMLRVSRSTLYRLMWSGQLIGHKVGSCWRFYRDDLQACIQMTPACSSATQSASSRNED